MRECSGEIRLSRLASTGLLLAMAGILLSWCASKWPAIAAFEAWNLLASLLVCLAIARNGNAGVTAVTQILAIGFALICATGLVQWLLITVPDILARHELLQSTIPDTRLPSPSIWDMPNEFPFGHKNWAGAAGGMASALFAGLLLLKDPCIPRRWALAGLVLSLTYLLSAASRGAMLGLAAACVSGVIEWTRARAGKKGLGIALGCIAGLLALALLHPIFRTAILHPIHYLHSDAERWGMMAAGMDMFAAHPLAGVGPGGVPFAYMGHWNGLGCLAPAWQLHSTPVQLLAEYGLFTAAGFLLIAIAALTPGRASATRDGTAGGRSAGLPLRLVLAGAIVTSLFDYAWNLPWFAMTTALVAGSLIAADRDKSQAGQAAGQAPPAWRTTLCAIPMILAIALAGITWERLCRHDAKPSGRQPSASDTAHALDTMGRAEMASALQHLEQAVRYDPSNATLHAQIGWIRLLHFPSGAGTAREAFQTAIRLDPQHPNAYLGLACVDFKAQGNKLSRRSMDLLAWQCLVNPSLMGTDWRQVGIVDRTTIIAETHRLAGSLRANPAASARAKAYLEALDSLLLLHEAKDPMDAYRTHMATHPPTDPLLAREQAMRLALAKDIENNQGHLRGLIFLNAGYWMTDKETALLHDSLIRNQAYDQPWTNPSGNSLIPLSLPYQDASLGASAQAFPRLSQTRRAALFINYQLPRDCPLLRKDFGLPEF